jgi:hypothetical protein
MMSGERALLHFARNDDIALSVSLSVSRRRHVLGGVVLVLVF